MKLQPPRQIQSQVALERKNQIDEGVKLAKKIDVLRETLSSMEAQRTAFIAGSQLELKKAIGDLEETKLSLENTVKTLEEKRKILIKPLDDAWLELNENKTKYKEDVSQLETRTHELTQKEKEISKRDQLSKEREINTQDQERTTGHLNREAQEFKTKAESLYKQQVQEYADHRREIDRETKRIAKREEENNAWAKALDRREVGLNIKEKKLEDKDKAINDKYDTLQRTIKRLK